MKKEITKNNITATWKQKDEDYLKKIHNVDIKSEIEKIIEFENEINETNVCGGFKHCVDRKYNHKFEDCETCKNDADDALAESLPNNK